ncbi:hypothetical protein MIV051L [Invertebrate iridescent virus 3]|uniref:Uncharacterized protein 051L n=1 Tax=Invertebrate iridescent virus 3 TaxID=345201 RepID=VF213_IIV3|nr:hypothetical protein MIV051L [Invertebrate iridescent virus 3]Q197A9.1 RecName: Full=Uncharacterized protein 051L; Flags: Precursor [Invertebrate iridescent virus 3]ABF82081.1 hypothetical protein MIV051L [Invertebrate iridescent virus 3]
MIDLLVILVSLLFGVVWYEKQLQTRIKIKEHFTILQPPPVIAAECPGSTTPWCVSNLDLANTSCQWFKKETTIKNLLGPANPKTLIPPVMVPRITDQSEWATDNYKLHSAINQTHSRALDYLADGQTTASCSSSPPLVYSSFNSNCCDGVKQGETHPLTVYDPRSVGGCTNPSRCFIDPVVGQPRYYYDDVNVTRAPNYITRNKLDTFSFGQTTGRLSNPNCLSDRPSINQLAVDHFHDNILQYRSSLMDSFRCKTQARSDQLRQFPISTNGQLAASGGSKV